MKILVTGNMGYVGPSVIQRLRVSYPGATIIGLDLGYFATCLTTTEIFPECRVDLQYFSDVRNFPNAVLEDVDVIVHLAAISNDPMGHRFEQATYDINHRASIELAMKAKQKGVTSFVFASSCSMYGFAEGAPKSEKSPLKPLTAYAKSKILTERDLEKMVDRTFKVTSLRFSTACGMSERLRLDLVLNDFVAATVTERKITILSDGAPWRPLINIKDMAKAIDWAIVRDISDGGPYLAVNVGSEDWNYQVRELAEAVAQVVPEVDITINKNAKPDKRSYRVNFDLFSRLAPDHQPEMSLLSTIKELKYGLETMNFAESDFRNSKFVRLKVLTDFCNAGLLNERLEWCNHQNTFQKNEEVEVLA